MERNKNILLKIFQLFWSNCMVISGFYMVFYISSQKINGEKMVIILNAIYVSIRDINYIIKSFAVHVTEVVNHYFEQYLKTKKHILGNWRLWQNLYKLLPHTFYLTFFISILRDFALILIEFNEFIVISYGFFGNRTRHTSPLLFLYLFWVFFSLKFCKTLRVFW